jgi:D-alanyl-D-alanine carboxypeptidase
VAVFEAPPKAGPSFGGLAFSFLTVLLFILALLVLLVATGLGEYRAQQRRAEAWRKVGSCEAVGDSPVVTCTGVTLTTITLPSSLAVCASLNPCEINVNAEAVPAFTSALAEVVAAGLSAHITQFGTVNRRRCKDARTAAYIPNCISKHSYGIAVDTRNFTDNANWEAVVAREPGVLKVVKIFKRNGFKWGGSFGSNFDPQHLEWEPGRS